MYGVCSSRYRIGRVRAVALALLWAVFSTSLTGVQAAGKSEKTPAAKAPAASKNLGTVVGTVKSRPRKYAKNALVYIKQVKGAFKPPAKHAKMDQKDLIFLPHIVPIVKGTTVDFLNSDNVLHNVFSPDHEKYNLGTWPRGEIRSYAFKRLGAYTQLCNVHPEMEAYVVVLQNPFFSKVKKNGTFKIEKVPPGRYVLMCWSEKLKDAKVEIDVVAGETVKADFSLRGKK